jgi:hypothetical protein
MIIEIKPGAYAKKEVFFSVPTKNVWLLLAIAP